ncbi:site-2 protease family protein [Bacillus songklensis]|uniref:Site-2 protease family protein n=1 Tax=Bacillus songklensis TaxID=1069116 RepID=A0ABV8B317_9BACI
MTVLKKNAAGIVAVLLLLAGKLKWVLAIFKFAKLSTLISMLVSFGAYALLYGWKFGIALIYLLFVHEMGHLVAARRKGIATSPAVFIPFMGAVIGMKELPKNAMDEAYIAYGGPLFGLLSFLPAVPLYLWTHDPFWGMVIGLGSLLNLFNLLPVSPLDGGRIVTVLSTKIWFIGLLILIPLMIIDSSAILILIFIIGLFTWWQRVRENYELAVTNGELTVLEEVKAVYKPMEEHKGVYEPIRSAEWSGYKERMAEAYRLKRKQTQLKAEGMKSFYIPFIQDDKKKEKATLQFRKEQYDRLVNVLENEHRWSEDHQELIRIQKEIKEREKKVEKLKTYYLTTKKEKWIGLGAYLLLLVVLGGFYIFGSGIMQQTGPFIS